MKRNLGDWLVYGAAWFALAYIAVFVIKQSHWIALLSSL